ncbi:hypothetical protein IKF89_00825 [Candidatus Saccharibacteria bacterium]|nr:hypothetical protein [Candidatus Saccharibacteria bacterium]
MGYKELAKTLFGNYQSSNFARVSDYSKKFHDAAVPFQNYSSPYFSGTPNLDFQDFLKAKELNYKPQPVDDVYRDVAPLLQNLPNWSNPGTMINVIPPVNLASLAAINYVQGLNPNFAQDTYAGFLILSELEVSKYISDLVGWDWKKSLGLFTFGGKGTNLYATKIALAKCDPASSSQGCEKGKYFILTSANAHPCHYEACDWLGIGKDSCIEIPCLSDGTVNLEETESIIRRELDKGKKFLGCNLNGGSTNELYIDPIKKVHVLFSRIAKDYGLQYRPHIHVDSVIGWIYLFFKDYDFKKNPLGIGSSSLDKIHKLSKMAEEFKYADSMGIDFHKTGFCPYLSSLFLCRRRKDYYAMNPSKFQAMEDLKYGNYNPYQTTLELTRSSTGALSALVSLKTLGVMGFQQMYAEMFEASEYFRQELAKDARICIINSESCWLASLFILKPKEYADLTLQDILKLNHSEIEAIKQYNVNFAKYIQRDAYNAKIDFVFTSSRSHLVPGTNIALGTLKAYPMSVFFDKKAAANIVRELRNEIDSYSKDAHVGELDGLSAFSDDMVYREK